MTKIRTGDAPIGNVGLNILEVLNHPDLLGNELTGPSWDSWIAFLCAVFALPIESSTI